MEQNFSLAKYLLAEVNGRPQEGFENDLTAEFRRASLADMPKVRGQVLPLSALTEQRSLTASSLVGTSVNSFFNSLQPNDFLRVSGVQFYEGLSMNNRIPAGSGFTLEFPGETGNLSEVSQTFNANAAAAYRVGGMVTISRQLFKNNPVVIEQYLRKEFSLALSAAIQRVLLNGTTASNEPSGISQTSGVSSTLTYSLSYEDLTAVEKTLGTNNAITEGTQWVISPSEAKTLREIQIDAGSGRTAYRERSILDYPATITSSQKAKTIIAGDFRRAAVGLHGVNDVAAVDILIDQQTTAISGTYKIYLNAYVSIQVQPQAFAVLTIN